MGNVTEESLQTLYSDCNLCPRNCGKNRESSIGICNEPDRLFVARAALHMWEEPCISGTEGSGAIFFSGCSLRCVFCQNHDISVKKFPSKD